MRIALLAASFLTFAAPAFADNNFEFDKSHTSISFAVSHMGMSNMIGMFTDYDGGFVFDPKNPAQGSVQITFKPTGVKTVSSELDSHLQGEKFFNSAKFPTVSFKSTAIKLTGEKTADITGDFTLLGVTKPVVLKTTFNKADFHPMTQQFMAGFTADTVVKRSEFGMKEYVPMVGDEVRIHIEVEGVNKSLSTAVKKD